MSWALQSHIARALADRVRVAVASRDEARLNRRVDPEATDDYLRGRSSWNMRTREGVVRALDSFRRAIDRDPTYAAAWAGVADCYIVFSGALLGLPEKEAYSKARQAALEALALDETLPEARTSLASVKSELDWNWAGAEAEDHACHRAQLQLRDGASMVRRVPVFPGPSRRIAAAASPRPRSRSPVPVVNNSLAISLLLAGRYDEALAQAKRTIEIDPGFAGAHLTLGSIYRQKDMHAEAIAALQRAVALSPGL